MHMSLPDIEQRSRVRNSIKPAYILSKETQDISFEICQSLNESMSLILQAESDAMDAIEHLKDPSQGGNGKRGSELLTLLVKALFASTGFIWSYPR